MKEKKSLWLLLLALALVIGGAYLLYEKLEDNIASDRLLVQEGQPQEEAEEEAGAAAEDGSAEEDSQEEAAEENGVPEEDSADKNDPQDDSEKNTASEETDSRENAASEETDSKENAASEETDSKENAASEENEAAEEDAENTPAPDFTVYDEEGEEVRLSDYAGKPVVLNFWASWCGPCRQEMPDFHEKYLELGQEIHFLMVNMTDGSRETAESASEFIEEMEYTFPVFYDKDMDATVAYSVYSLPTTFFIDADGYAIAQAAGSIDSEILQSGIDMILQ